MKLKVEKIVEDFGVDPLEALYFIGLDDANPVDQRIKALGEVASFMYAKKKQVDHKGKVQGGGGFNLQIIQYKTNESGDKVGDPMVIDMSPRESVDDESDLQLSLEPSKENDSNE